MRQSSGGVLRTHGLLHCARASAPLATGPHCCHHLLLHVANPVRTLERAQPQIAGTVYHDPLGATLSPPHHFPSSHICHVGEVNGAPRRRYERRQQRFDCVRRGGRRCGRGRGPMSAGRPAPKPPPSCDACTAHAYALCHRALRCRIRARPAERLDPPILCGAAAHAELATPVTMSPECLQLSAPRLHEARVAPSTAVPCLSARAHNLRAVCCADTVWMATRSCGAGAAGIVARCSHMQPLAGVLPASARCTHAVRTRGAPAHCTGCAMAPRPTKRTQERVVLP